MNENDIYYLCRKFSLKILNINENSVIAENLSNLKHVMVGCQIRLKDLFIIQINLALLHISHETEVGEYSKRIMGHDLMIASNKL